MCANMDEKTAKNARNKAKQAQLDRDDFVKAACTTKQGREYLSWVMGLGRPNENPYAGNALATAFRCGEANISKQIERHILLAAPKGYFQILEDQQKEALNDYTDFNTSDSDADTSGASTGSAID
jgi:hypothetical protein